MRLTLRTLLAWLDDKLLPDQVSEIGKQVGESPMAQELVERIHRVTRQRRLTVPGRSGSTATDPNLVAGYLDNDIEQEQVSAYEKKCLASDVDLAEVASAHQILSNLGQKVPVPAEARARMYLLVKGREAHRARPSDGAVEKPDDGGDGKPITPWALATDPPRRRLERVGPIAAFLALLGVLCWSAYESMKPSPRSTAPALSASGEGAGALAAPTPELGGEPGANQTNAEPVAPSPPNLAEESPAPTPEPTQPVEEADRNIPPAPNIAGEPIPEIPDDAVGVVAHVDGLLLRYNSESREWERLAAGSAVGGLDRLLVLPPFRARVAIGGAVLDLSADTEIQITQRTKEEDPALDVAHGRIMIEPSSSETPIHVAFGGRALDVTPSAGAAIGLELLNVWKYGAATAAAPVLAVHATQGETALKMGETRETLTGPGSILAGAAGGFERPAESDPPEWLAHPQPPTPEEVDRIENYLKQFPDDRPILTDIVSATDNDDNDLKTLAIQGLRALGDLSFLTPILDRPDDPGSRQAAMAALRDHLAAGPRTDQDWKQLLGGLGLDDDDLAKLKKLLLGFDERDAENPATYEDLVQMLSPDNESIALRELAFDNLKRLSGRTTIPYNADEPDAGFAAWKKLLDDGELHAAPK